ncbi:MAG: hypothetical protein QNJ94_07820 [Alphaproteobacteria bacterium]|nr:hypothetical protein [Alphaproteobacteria bacterium]
MQVLILLAAAGVAALPVRAEGGLCRFVEAGHGYVTVDQEGSVWTYALQVAGPLWTSAPYDYHSSGVLFCVGCRERFQPGGLFHLGATEELAADSEIKRPATAWERVARRKEIFGYPMTVFDGAEIEVHATRDDAQIGPLAGYAVLYRLNEFLLEEYWAFAGIDDAGQVGLLVVSLTDGCVDFETTIMTPMHHGRIDWTLLASLEQEVSITKTAPVEASEPEPEPATKPPTFQPPEPIEPPIDGPPYDVPPVYAPPENLPPM